MTTAAELTVESLQTQLIERDQKILYLEEQLAWFTRQIFGKKSERLVDTDPEQLKLDGFESEESQGICMKNHLTPNILSK